jgi:hypothetical protein
MFLFIVLVLICSKKDLGIFLKVGSYGVIFIVMLMVFIVATGIIAFGNTTFMTGSAKDNIATNWSDNERTLVLFNTNFAPLAGILCCGYFLHT